MTERKHIVIEGPIGVGKTSLAKRLADSLSASHSCRLILEGAQENPFLERFYDDPKYGALPTQLFFLFQRARQMETLSQTDLFGDITVSDFLIDKDRLFAELTLSPDELALYQNVYNNLDVKHPVPDLVIYLQAPVPVLQERISNRGIRYEQKMGSGYLQKIVNAYLEFFLSYHDSALLIVNAQSIDWVNNARDYQLLLDEITRIEHGRHFFNPHLLMAN